MKVVWTPEAELDREEIFDYIAADNPRAAVRMDELFDAAVARLKNRGTSPITSSITPRVV